MSLRLRIVLAAALLLVVACVLGVLLVRSIGDSEVRQVDQQLEDSLPVARTISPSSPTLPSGSASHNFTANHFSAFYIASISKGHRTVISTPVDAKKSAPRTPSVLSTSRKNVNIVTVGSKTGSLKWRAILVARPSSNSDLLVAVSLAEVDTTMSFLRDALLLAGLIMLAVLAATSFWIARLGLRPIAEVTEVADAITAGDRTRRVTSARRGTEAGKLAEAFNLMLDEQLALEARLRQFIADASHELRTPVSVILGIAELWREGQLRVGEDRDEAMHRIGVAGNQMGKLVEELLLLARLDEGQSLDRQRVDLAQLVNDVVADASTTDPYRTITVDVTSPVLVEGDIFALRRVVANLVNNALRHTPRDARIEVRLSSDERTARLEVEDSGPGMTREELGHAFDRFWQADSSRSRSGAGLGLPIVRGIVAAHGGEVTLESTPAAGTRFTVTVPRIAGSSEESPLTASDDARDLVE
ncbi:MAG TPA: HAMP domain-containing sensor histidine kinase [Acidimicrobiales bacterium]|nr:HAMP domain-containing sensor histidine kinase [Acidimicrobiales bacterium]